VDRAVEECVQEGTKRETCQRWFQPEQPRHRVAIDTLYLDRYEVNNRLFEKFVQATGHRTTAEREGNARAYVKGKGWETVNGASWRQPEGEATVFVSNRREHPVVAVSWEDATTYCRHYGKRLPTEAEWEYAARAGTQTRYWWGNGNPGFRRVANVADESAKRLFKTIMTGYDDGYERTAPVGVYDANPWGLHDMIGNVNEWTADWYGSTYYQQSPERNPQGPSSGEYRVLRGGSWNNQPFGVRSANRNWITPTNRVVYVGFRCAQDAP
jgi:formylglycine-generating enzyme required for sulfatase activity